MFTVESNVSTATIVNSHALLLDITLYDALCCSQTSTEEKKKRTQTECCKQPAPRGNDYELLDKM